MQAVGHSGPVGSALLLGLVDAVHDVAVERVHLLAHELVGLATSDVGVAGQVFHLVLEVGQVGSDVVLEVVTHTVGPVDAHVDTGVENLANVLEQGAVLEGQTRRDHGLARHAVEPVDVDAQAVAQGGELNAHVGLVDNLPFQVGEVTVVLESGDGGIAEHAR